MRERRDSGRMGRGGKNVSVVGYDTLVAFNDMLSVLFPSLSHASVIHKGLCFQGGHWVARSLEMPQFSITNKQ